MDVIFILFVYFVRDRTLFLTWETQAPPQSQMPDPDLFISDLLENVLFKNTYTLMYIPKGQSASTIQKLLLALGTSP